MKPDLLAFLDSLRTGVWGRHESRGVYVVGEGDAGVPHYQLVGRESVPGHGEGGGA